MITVVIGNNETKVKEVIAEMLKKLGNTAIFIRREADTVEIMEKGDIRSQVSLKDKIIELGEALYAEKRGALYKNVLAVIERPLLEYVLERTEGNQLKAARILGINRNTIRAKIKKLGINTNLWKVF